jgi:RHS repeat-associated protein
MGCRKLSYYAQDKALGTKSNFLKVLKEKSVCAEKIDIDYFTFGMPMPGRQFSSNSYRYGFQGQEKDDEVKGNGNSVNYKFRMHDPRLGRFLSIDPLAKEYPFYSPYAFSGNRVIDAFELEGLEPVSISGEVTGFLGLSEQQLNVVRYASQRNTVNRSGTKIDVVTENYVDGKAQTTLTLGLGAKQSHVTDYSAGVIHQAASAAGESNILINSSFRNAYNQARVMYNKTIKDGRQSMLNLYLPYGDEVVKVMDSYGPQWNCSSSECIQEMTDKINELGPRNVSAHSSDPNVYNVIDIDRNLDNQSGFKSELKDKSRNFSGGENAPINKYIPPGGSEKANHIEIPQR